MVKIEPVATAVDLTQANWEAIRTGQLFTPNEAAVVDALRALGAGGHVARKIAELATGSTSVAAHKPIYAALDALAARGLVVKAGRTYALPEGA